MLMKFNSKKITHLYIFLALILLLFLLLLVIQNAKAISVNMEGGNFQTIFVNQQIEFTANSFDGTPPYTYQWCTQTWNSIWGSPIGSIIEVPGATSSTFKFSASTPGVYDISLKVWDSAGNYSYFVGLPAGVWVTVKAKNFTNPIIEGTPNATIMIQSPINKTYNQNNIVFNYTIQSNNAPMEFFNGTLLNYWVRHGVALDYDTDKLVNLIENTNLLDQFPDNPSINLSKIDDYLYGGNITLTNLSQGNHNITVWLRTEQDYLSYGIPVGSIITTISFNVDSIPSKVLILSPQTKTYNTSDVSLNFTINKPFSNLLYSLDNQEDMTLTENVTLTNLSNGNHNIIVYATDFAGNVGSSQTSFTIDRPTSESFPLMPIIASIAIITIVSVSLLIYFKKRKHQD